MSWQPVGQRSVLARRAQLIQAIRLFLIERGYLEVETPLLCQHTVTDPFIDSFQVNDRYLQTSPEFSMKRLLAAGSGPIFQISKAFRLEEMGQRHNPEFTLLEWYRPGYNHLDLIQEIDTLLQTVLNTPPLHVRTYQACFEEYLNINPHTIGPEECQRVVKTRLNIEDIDALDTTTLLQLLMSEHIEPDLGIEQPTVLIDYPVAQAALAKINHQTTPPVAERFELYWHGIELANGFHELNDQQQQKQRFIENQQQRRHLNKSIPAICPDFIHCLPSLPDCAGVALGIDRLVMLACQQDSILNGMTFNWQNA